MYQALNQIAGSNYGFYLFKSLRNSPMYLNARKPELLTFICQHCIPTWFLSLSAGDFYWKDILRSLCYYRWNLTHRSRNIKAHFP